MCLNTAYPAYSLFLQMQQAGRYLNDSDAIEIGWPALTALLTLVVIIGSISFT